MIRLLRVQRLAATHAVRSDQPVPLLAAMAAVLLLAAVLQPLLAVLQLLLTAVLLLAATAVVDSTSAEC